MRRPVAQRYVSLAGARRSNSENDVARPDRIEVALLVDALGSDLTIADADQHRFGDNFLERFRSARKDLDCLFYVRTVHRVTGANHTFQLLNQLGSECQRFRRPGEVKFRSPLPDFDPKPPLDNFEIGILLPAQVSGDVVVCQINLRAGRRLDGMGSQIVSFLLVRSRPAKDKRPRTKKLAQP